MIGELLEKSWAQNSGRGSTAGPITMNGDLRRRSPFGMQFADINDVTHPRKRRSAAPNANREIVMGPAGASAMTRISSPNFLWKILHQIHMF